MKILGAVQIKEWDAYTIKNEPIISIYLMERAANAFLNKFLELVAINEQTIYVFCGNENNGGDGLAIARLLFEKGAKIYIFLVENEGKKSEDNLKNLNKLPKQLKPITIKNISEFPQLEPTDIVIDAILGIGLTRPVVGVFSDIIQFINSSKLKIISVDVPSGLYIDKANDPTDVIIHANITISFQIPKLAFFMPQNAEIVGDWYLVEIGLDKNYIHQCQSQYNYTIDVNSILKIRPKFSNKGTYGHALLIAGSYGMMGAAILTARASMRSGLGKLTVYIPKCGYEIMQIAVPEAMVITDMSENIHSQSIDCELYNAIGIGPGLGKNTLTISFLKKFLLNQKGPIVIDADALNIISENNMHNLIPKHSILTPHPKEFEKLIRKTWANDFEKLEFLKYLAIKKEIVIVLKGANTAIAMPNGDIHFNSSGNTGLAKAGTGDVLTGMITALLAQGYSSENAALIGVFCHGKAAEMASTKRNISAIMASDIIEEISI